MRELFEFLFITNRQVTVLGLLLMFPLDGILFWHMGKRSMLNALVFASIFILEFAWFVTWFSEPSYGFSYERVIREMYLIASVGGKALLVYHFLHRRRADVLEVEQGQAEQQRDRTISILIGILVSVLSGVLLCIYWLYSDYQADQLTKQVEDRHQRELAEHDRLAKQQMIQVYTMVYGLIADFKAEQAKGFSIIQAHSTQLDKLEAQSAKELRLAEKTAQDTKSVKNAVLPTHSPARSIKVDTLPGKPHKSKLRQWLDDFFSRAPTPTLPDSVRLAGRRNRQSRFHHKP